MIDENSTFGGFLTAIGEAKQTNANALEIPWRLTHMLLGDANGTDPVPDPEQTQLINQVYRAAINQLFVDSANPGILIAELVLPPNVGGWWIRELGLEDEDGDFVAVANCAPSYKPLLAQGSGRNQVVRMHLIVSNTANVQLKIDPSVVLATRQYVDVQRTQHEQDAEAHADNQITLSAEIPQAPDATDVAGALAALGAFAASACQNVVVFTDVGVTAWAVPDVLKAGLRHALVEVQGGGGSGWEGGGGGGAYATRVVSLAGIETVSITVGEGGVSAPGGTSSFGSYVSANGGGRGSSSMGRTGTATFTGGDFGIRGGGGHSSQFGGMGGDSYFGNGGPGSSGDSNDGGGGGGYGAGGGGLAGYQGVPGVGSQGIVIVRW